MRTSVASRVLVLSISMIIITVPFHHVEGGGTSLTCLDDCPPTTPKCCTTIDADICCPANTECDFNFGCTLPTSPRGGSPGTTRGSTDSNSSGEEDHRSPLHESFTVVFIKFTSMARLMLMGALIVAFACAFGFGHTTAVIRLQAWFRRRREEQQREERRESSDEEPDVIIVTSPPVSSHSIEGLPAKDLRPTSYRHTHDGDDELQPLTAVVSREPTPLPPTTATTGLRREGGTTATGEGLPTLSEGGSVQPRPGDGGVSTVVPGDGESTCLVCGDAINCVLLRCHHAVTCYQCSRKVRDCPKCGCKIHRRQKLFLV